MVASHKRNELVLIASDGEWFARSLESVLELNGYAVQRSMGGSKAIESAHEFHPDAILLDDAQSDVSTVGVCRSLRDDPSFRGALKMRTLARSCAPENLEIPGLRRFAHPGMTAAMTRQKANISRRTLI